MKALLDTFQLLDLNSRKATVRACVTVPVLFAIWSLYLGQDRNWDLMNYHLYNAFSFLNGKLGVDFAPAGMQTYFNPVLDVFYFGLNEILPAPMVGVLMGYLHGLNFVVLVGIAHEALPDLPEEDKYRTPLLLAVAGAITANFLSGEGNSMGDDTTAIFILGAALLLLRQWQTMAALTPRSAGQLVAAGFFAGLAMGLKLTNATYAVALCFALLFVPGSPTTRVRVAFVFGIGVLAGVALTGGYWMWVLWQKFGNPFFPQFSSIFPHPLTPPVGVSDRSWLPRNLFEYIAWPFVFALDSKRVGQARLHQIIWPVVYVLFIAFVCCRLSRVLSRRHQTRLSPKARYLLVFVAIGYILWMVVFSIYRYIVPIEMLAPLIAYLLLTGMFPYATARRVAAFLLAATSAVVLFGGVETWGHERWALRAFRADVPVLDKGATLVLVGGNPAWAWLAQFYPVDAAFTQIDGSFPLTPLYDEQIIRMIRSRNGQAYAVVEGKYNWRAESVANMNDIFQLLGLGRGAQQCDLSERVVRRLHLHARLVWNAPASRDQVCHLDIRSDDVRDIRKENADLIDAAQSVAERHGLRINATTCTDYRAYIGQGIFPYQLCRIRPVP
ncbi:hypothetical protein [Paraburkholderia caledonica]|uniref:hypothetical protein n=1 Tax=Paraburkholderia caledonica TaxID=134536 RepID=UPI00035E6AF6|nr:hypothetical protein [Paraburkholderia caledonica]